MPRTPEPPRAKTAERPEFNFDIAISYLEVYNESGYDLLDPSHDTKDLEDLLHEGELAWFEEEGSKERKGKLKKKSRCHLSEWQNKLQRNVLREDFFISGATIPADVMKVKMTHARDPKQMFLKTHEEKNGGTKQAESATGTHTHTHTHTHTSKDRHRRPQTNSYK